VPRPVAAPAADAGVTYDKFVKDTERQVGLFPLIRKDGKIYMELTTSQLNKEYYEHATSANGLGGFGLLSGDDFLQEARIFKFVRIGPKAIAVIYPQIRFQSQSGTAIDNAVRASTADSVQAVVAIAVEDKGSGKIVIDPAFLLGDNLDLGTGISQSLERNNPLGAYRLDPTRTYYGPSKAFPKNVIIEADQTFVSARPRTINTVVDPRTIQFRIKYNISEVLSTPGYMPRYADDRVGYWDEQYVQFDHDNRFDNHVHYAMRWNIEASDPTRPSPAKKPLVYTLTNTIPEAYRPAIREAILEWNKAFVKIGILNAIQVQDQPNDPNWDPDDIRYNTIRWLTENNGGGFAEAQLEWDPRTGEVFRSGVLIDSDIMRFSSVVYARSGPGLAAFARSDVRTGAMGSEQDRSDCLRLCSQSRSRQVHAPRLQHGAAGALRRAGLRAVGRERPIELLARLHEGDRPARGRSRLRAGTQLHRPRRVHRSPGSR